MSRRRYEGKGRLAASSEARLRVLTGVRVGVPFMAALSGRTFLVRGTVGYPRTFSWCRSLTIRIW